MGRGLQAWPWHSPALPTCHAHSHGDAATAAVTAPASQRGCEAVGDSTTELHQPAGTDPGEGVQGPGTAWWGQLCGAGPGQLLPDPPTALSLQAQQMTAQAMSLSLEQQTQQRQAQALGAASSTPTPVISPKPKKPPAPQEEPERELESVGACLWVRGGHRQKAGPGGGQQGRGLWGQETQGWRCGKTQKRCHWAPVPGIQGVCCESGSVTGRPASSF